MKQKSILIGIGVTIVWFLSIYIFCVSNEFSFSSKDLNSLGDFLAGIFAPVAFFWLILGYVQQGKQLEQNTQALEQQEQALQLQIEEMRESVKEQRSLALLQKEQLQAIYTSAKPEIYVSEGKWKYMEFTNVDTKEKSDNYLFDLVIRNIGIGQARYIELWYGNIHQLEFQLDRIEESHSSVNKLDKDNIVKIDYLILFDYELDFNDENKVFTLKIKYMDIYNQNYEVDFDIVFYFENNTSKSGDIIAIPK